MKPFSTPVLAKRTYRELKLLKHIQHENVGPQPASPRFRHVYKLHAPDHQLKRRLHLAPRGSVGGGSLSHTSGSSKRTFFSYFVTELLGTDLHRLLTSRPLEKQFIQYFLYQILVRYPWKRVHRGRLTIFPSAVLNTYIPREWSTVTSYVVVASRSAAPSNPTYRNPATSWSTRTAISR